MMALTTLQSAPSLLAHLTDSAVRALFLGAAVSLGLFAFRVKATPARLFTWSAVLYAALAMPFLGWMLPRLAIPTPFFLQSGLAQTTHVEVQNTEFPRGGFSSIDKNVAAVRNEMERKKSPGEILSASSSSMPSGVSQPSRATQHIPWSMVAAAVYFAVASLLLARLLVGFVCTRRLVKSSQTICEHHVTVALSSRAFAYRLIFVPQIAESEVVSVPVTVGVLRSTILLPAAWREWDSAKLDAIIAHELSHVARRDALTQRISLLHRAIFWFSPLAWWLDRHLAELAEQASDEAALSCGADCGDYALTLLAFFEVLRAAPGRVWWQGVAMAKSGQAEQRVNRILEWKDAGGNIAMGLKKSFAVMIVALAIPAVYIAASANPVGQTQSSFAQHSQDPPPPTTADAPLGILPTPGSAPAAPQEPSAPVVGIYSESGPPPTPPPAPMPPSQPTEPTPPTAIGGSSSGHHYSYAYGYDDDSRFVIVSANSDGVTVSGSTEDIHHAQSLRAQIPGDFIWFEHDEKSYIIRDQATIARARKFWEPQEELSKKQEALGKQQEALGKQQGVLGEKQQQVQVRVPDMSAELDKLKAELKQLSSGATQDQIGKVQSEIGELQSRMGELQSQAGTQQSKLGEQQSALGEQQSKLGEQQSELGRQQSELSKQADRQMRELLDEAIKNGTAKPETEMGKPTL
jgi:beta-lactamase regulating signal transducer with metallopeptidase domain